MTMTIEGIAKIYNLPESKISEFTSSKYTNCVWHRGFILVTEEIINSPSGNEVMNILSGFFIERLREPKENGVIKIEGWSYLFDECKELECPQYDAMFSNNGVIRFDKFVRL